MPTYEPSLKIAHAFLDPETRKALSQVETTIELTNRSLRFRISPFNQDDDRLGDWFPARSSDEPGLP
jgi:hypothetical protein